MHAVRTRSAIRLATRLSSAFIVSFLVRSLPVYKKRQRYETALGGTKREEMKMSKAARAVVYAIVYLLTPVPSTEDNTLDYSSGWG